jgi:prepilin-type N-terminal cleavage/methylation domain-containing protein
MSEAMHRHSVFSGLLLRMVSMGEASGSLDKGLDNVSGYYNEVIPRRIKNLFSVLEPALMLFLIFMIGCVALAIYLPIYLPNGCHQRLKFLLILIPMNQIQKGLTGSHSPARHSTHSPLSKRAGLSSGFSLIEFIGVMAVLAILAAMDGSAPRKTIRQRGAVKGSERCFSH